MSFDSPLLPVPEILVSFKESDINVTENDFKNPDSRRWIDIYSQIFEALVCRSIDQVIQSLMRVESMHTDYHDLFEEGFAQVAFTSCLQRSLCNIGFTSFSIRDVIQPTPKRVQRIASVFLNAARHNQIRRAICQDILENIEKSRGEYESVIKHNKKLKQILSEAKETQGQRDAEFQVLQEEFEQGQQLCLELNKLQEEERRSVEELKLKMAKLDTEKDNMKQQISSVQVEVEKMSHKIVQSPKRFLKDLERLKNKVDEMKTELGKKEQALSENRFLLEQTVNKLAAAEKAVKLSKEVQSDQDKENEADAEIRSLSEKHSELKDLYSAYCSHDEDLTEKLRVRHEQKHKISSQINIRDRSTYQHLADLKQQRDKLSEKIAELRCKTSETAAMTACISDEILGLDKMVETKRNENKRELLEAAAEISSLQQLMSQDWAQLKATILSTDDCCV